MLIKAPFIQQRALAMAIGCLLLLLAALGITFLIYLFNFGYITFMLNRTPIEMIATSKMPTSSANVPLAAIHDIVVVLDDDSITTTDTNRFGDNDGGGIVNTDVTNKKNIEAHDIYTETVARANDGVGDDDDYNSYIDHIYDLSDVISVHHNNDDLIDFHQKYHNAANDDGNDDDIDKKMKTNIVSGILSTEHRVAYNRFLKLNQFDNDDYDHGDSNVNENKRQYYYVMPTHNYKHKNNNNLDVNGDGEGGDSGVHWDRKPNRKTKKIDKDTISNHNNNNSNKLNTIVVEQSPQQQSTSVLHDAIYIDDFESPTHQQPSQKQHNYLMKQQRQHMQKQKKISTKTTYQTINNNENKKARVIDDIKHHKNRSSYNNKTNRHNPEEQQHQIDNIDKTYDDSVLVNYKGRALVNDVHDHNHDDDDNNFHGSGNIEIYLNNNDRHIDNDDDYGDDDEGDNITDGYNVVKDGSGKNIIFNSYMQQFDAETSHFIQRINNRMSLYNNILGLKRNGSAKRYQQHNINSRNLQKQQNEQKRRKSKSMTNNGIEQQQPQKQQILYTKHNEAVMRNTLLPRTTTPSTIELLTEYNNNNNVSIKTIPLKQHIDNINARAGVHDIGVSILKQRHHQTNVDHLHTKYSKTTPSTSSASFSVISSSSSPSLSLPPSSLTKSWLDTRTHRIIGNVKKSEERSRQLLLCEEAGGGELCRMLFKGHLSK